MHRHLGDLWHFSRKYRQFQRLSALVLGLLGAERELSQQGREALARLDRERIVCQERIASLNLPAIARCADCAAGCCGEPADHYFTAIDYWLRKYTDNGVRGFSQEPFTPLPKYYRFRISEAVKRGRGPKRTTGRGPCAHLGAAGCSLSHAERPLKCLIYACPGLKRSLYGSTRETYIEEVGKLHRISLEAFNILKEEAGLPPSYGLASIRLTL